MDRNKHPTSYTFAKPAIVSTGSTGFFHNGSASSGIPATIPTADWANGITEEIRNTIISAGLTPNINDDTQLSQAVSLLGQGYNMFINGQMRLANRASSSVDTNVQLPAGTSGKKYLCDRWLIDSVGSTYSADRVRTGPLTVEYLPGNPENVLHVTVSSVAGAGNYCCIRQSIEDVRATAARVCSVSFWLNSSVDCNISFVCRQNLGAESVFVHGQKYAVKSATWNRFTSTFSVPSIIGKTLISGSHALECYLYFDAGTNFNSQTQSLGHQSVQARVTNAMFSFSNVPIDFFGQDNGIEDVLAERYYEKSCVVNPNKEDVGFNGAYTSVQVVGAGIETLLGHIRFNTRKRITPTVRLLNPVGLTNSAVRNDTINANSSTATVTRLNSEAFNVMYTTAPGSAVGNLNAVQWDADAEFY